MNDNWKSNVIIKGGHYAYLNGKYHKFQGAEKCLDELKNEMQEVLDYAARVVEENNQLKEEHWKDDRLQEMKEKLEVANNNCYRGFPITEEQNKKIRDWEDQHWTNQHAAPDTRTRLAKMGAIGGSFYYKFVPTSIGTSGCIVCSSCMEKARRNCGDNRDRLRELIKEYDAEFQFQEIG